MKALFIAPKGVITSATKQKKSKGKRRTGIVLVASLLTIILVARLLRRRMRLMLPSHSTHDALERSREDDSLDLRGHSLDLRGLLSAKERMTLWSS